MPSEPFADAVGVALIVFAALFLAAVVWLLVRKYRAEQSRSMECTPPKLASLMSTPMLNTSPLMEYHQQPRSVTPADKEYKASALPTPTVDTSYVLAKECSAIGKSPSRPLDAASKSESRSRSRSGVASKSLSALNSYAGDRDQLPATARDFTTEQELTWGVPKVKEQAGPLTEPMGGLAESHYSFMEATKTEDQRKPLPEAEDGFKIEHRAPTELSVAGGQTPTAEFKDQYKEQRHVSQEAQKRKGWKASGGSSDMSTAGSARRQRKHYQPEALPAVDSVKPSASRNPEMTSSYRPDQEAADGAFIGPSATLKAPASTAATPAPVNAAVDSKKDDTKVRDDERSSRKSQAKRSPRKKSKGQVSTTSCTPTPAVVRVATSKPSASGHSAALPTAIAASAASFSKMTPKATLQEPVKPVVTSLADKAAAENSGAMPSQARDRDSLPPSSSHASPVSIASTTSGGTEDVYKTAKASLLSTVPVERASEADKDAALAAGSANVPVFPPLATGPGPCATTAPGITGTVTNSLAAAPDLRTTATSLRARSSADKKGLA